jgi:membrane protein DedA with SNARE-associated domain
MTSFVGDHGLAAVALLMFISALLPAFSELTMLYAGALASGALEGHVGHFQSGFRAYLAVVVVAVAANVAGAVVGWWIGHRGGQPLLEKHGRWLHATPERVDRAERWFARFGNVAVPLGFATPLVRSFVALPAGILGWPLRRFVPLATVGCAIFCSIVAGLGWAVGASWHSASHDLRYLDYLVLSLVVLAVVIFLVRRRTTDTIRESDADPPR